MSDTQAQTPAARGPVTITLSQPLPNLEHILSTVTLKPPTGIHLMKAGAVMRYITKEDTGELSIEIVPDGMGKLIAACGGLSNRAMEQMPACDFMACASALMPFLAPTATS